MVRAIKGLTDGKAPGGDGIPAEVWNYGGANLSNRLTPMDHQNMGGRSCTTRLEGCQHNHHLQKKGDRTECGHLPRYISSFCSRQDLCSDPTKQTLKPDHPSGDARNAVRLSFKAGAQWT